MVVALGDLSPFLPLVLDPAGDARRAKASRMPTRLT
jgi:hypothetical protein